MHCFNAMAAWMMLLKIYFQCHSSRCEATHFSPMSSQGDCVGQPSSSATLQIADNLAADPNISSEQLFTAHAHRVLQLQSSRFCELSS